MNQNIENFYLNACCMYVAHDGVWFVQGMCPILYFYSFSEKGITLSQPLLIEQIYGTAFFSEIYMKNNTLYIIPNNATKIIVYNIESNTYDIVDIEDSGVNIYINCYEYNGELFCIPYKAKKMLIMCMGNYRDIKYIERDKNDHIINDTCRIENIVYCVIWKTSNILQIDLEKKTMHCVSIEGSYQFTSICAYNNLVFLYDAFSRSIITMTKDLALIVNLIEINCDDAIIYLHKGRYIVADSALTDEIVIIDTKINKVVNRIVSHRLGQQLIDSLPWKINAWAEDNEGSLWGITTEGNLVKMNHDALVVVDKMKICTNRYAKINGNLVLGSQAEILQERIGFCLENYIDECL